jgi:hypothetical protein
MLVHHGLLVLGLPLHNKCNMNLYNTFRGQNSALFLTVISYLQSLYHDVKYVLHQHALIVGF